LIGEYLSLAHVNGNQPFVNKGCLFPTDSHFLAENVSACIIAWNFFPSQNGGHFKIKCSSHFFWVFQFLKCSISFNDFLPLKLEGYLSSIIGKKKKKKKSTQFSTVFKDLGGGLWACTRLQLM
jgi:hypothetical protein